MGKLRAIQENHEYQRAHKRLNSVPLPQVHAWAMNSLWSIQEGLEQYQAQADPAALDVARKGALALLAATEVLVDNAV